MREFNHEDEPFYVDHWTVAFAAGLMMGCAEPVPTETPPLTVDEAVCMAGVINQLTLERKACGKNIESVCSPEQLIKRTEERGHKCLP